jgi:hypothetical protein
MQKASLQSKTGKQKFERQYQVWLRKSTYSTITKLSKRYGVTKSQVAQISFQIGLPVLEDALTKYRNEENISMRKEEVT